MCWIPTKQNNLALLEYDKDQQNVFYLQLNVFLQLNKQFKGTGSDCKLSEKDIEVTNDLVLLKFKYIVM